MVNLLAAAAIAAATPQPAPAAVSEPAIFVVRDADTTVYIFGTFHALDSDAGWFDHGVKDAFQQSDELILETLLPEGPPVRATAAAAPAVQAGAPNASFLATTQMAISAGRAQGMQVDNGADMVLRHIAEAEGKPVEGLETLEFQLNMFNSLRPTAVAPSASIPTQSGGEQPMQTLSRTMSELQSAWKRGDQTMFVRMLDQLRAGSPDTYRMMFTERNARWADWIAARMQTAGTVFIAVGAGHLAGKDSLLVRLAEKGIASQRVY